jgi:hypothetical protein
VEQPRVLLRFGRARERARERASGAPPAIAAERGAQLAPRRGPRSAPGSRARPPFTRWARLLRGAFRRTFGRAVLPPFAMCTPRAHPSDTWAAHDNSMEERAVHGSAHSRGARRPRRGGDRG